MRCNPHTHRCTTLSCCSSDIALSALLSAGTVKPPGSVFLLILHLCTLACQKQLSPTRLVLLLTHRVLCGPCLEGHESALRAPASPAQLCDPRVSYLNFSLVHWFIPAASFHHEIFLVGVCAELFRGCMEIWGKAEPSASSGEQGWGVHMESRLLPSLHIPKGGDMSPKGDSL